MSEGRRPDFFIIGAPKSGTTALDRYLGRHPDIFMCPYKDYHFLAPDLHQSHPRDPQEFERTYLGYFTEAGGASRVGESSVLYLYSHEAPQAIKAFNSEAQAVALLRNPVEMIASHHSQLLYTVDETLTDLRSALEAEPRRRQGRDVPRSVTSRDLLYYREIADYAPQLERYFETLGRENVHVVLFDDFKADTAAAYAGVLSFLGVDPEFRPPFEVVNPNKRMRFPGVRRMLKKPGAWKEPFKKILPESVRYRLVHGAYALMTRVEQRPPMDPDLERDLKREFAPAVERLGRLLNRDLSHWSRVS